jgi:hypothetical protein
MSEEEFNREVTGLIQRSGRCIGVVVAEQREDGIYTKAYGNGDLAGKFTLTATNTDYECKLSAAK